MKGSKLLREVLEKERVRYIFGVPGDIENSLFKELGESSIRFINTRREDAGAFMADAFARTTGELGVCFSTLGPGATNMVTGVANAFQDRSAVLALSGQLPTSKQGPGAHQYVDLSHLYSAEGVAKAAHMVRKPGDLAVMLNRAIFLAKEEMPGPVHLTLPTDVLDGEAKGARVVEAEETTRFDYHAALSDLHRMIRESRDITVIFGNEVARSGAGDQLATFLRQYEIPAYSTFQGNGVLAPDHPSNCGVLSRHSKKAREVLGKQGLIITVGYDSIEGVMPDMWAEAKNTVHISESTAPLAYNPGLEVTGNTREVLERLNREFPAQSRPNPERDKMQIRAECRSYNESDFPVNPVRVVRELGELLGPEDTVVSDVGLHKQVVGMFYQPQTPSGTLFSNGLSSMGFAIPAANAVKLARPDSRVVAVCGDGGFQMSSQELITAKENGLGTTVIVMNDGALGMVRSKQLDTVGVTHAAEFKESPDFAELARAYGAKGIRVNGPEELRPALREALNSDDLYIIDVPIKHYSDVEIMS